MLLRFCSVLRSHLPIYCGGIVFLWASTLICAGSGPASSDAQSSVAKTRQIYSDQIQQHYHFAFGKGDISAPGNAAAEGAGFMPPSAFPTASYCGHCHQEAYHQWRQALHANSFRTPFYRHSVNILLATKGIEYSRHCDSCHNPIAVLGGAIDANYTHDRSFDRDGVTCMVCHSIQSVDSKEGNGGYVLGVPAVMVDAQGNRIPGIVPDAKILAHLDRHSKAVMQPIYHSAVFCEACHKANLPPMLNDYKWIRAFSTYDEWQTSKYSHQTPLNYYPADQATCQGCHMMRSANMLPEPGAKNGAFASHRWLAGNTAVPFYYGYDEQLQKTIDFLRSGNFLNVDIFALRVNKTQQMFAPLGSVPFHLSAGQWVDAYVVVQNKGIGHSLIPEIRDLYEAWLQFSATDASGKVIYQSGYLRPDGTLEPGAHSYTNRPVNVIGDFVDNHMVWAIHSVAYDNTIQSGHSDLVRYRFMIPAGEEGPITLHAQVNYRHLRQTYLNNVLGPNHPSYPVVELASGSRTVALGDNWPQAPLPGANPDWMRWNNAGIGYLDELQHQDAVDAFEQVLRLRPDYKDGYVNLGFAYIDWEKYEDARAPLEKALALKPHDARALYYMALVERRARHSGAEVADLQDVVAQYPDCREARRELGISYYQQHRPDDAIAQFKALQAIDPDDLAAHYNLAILYRRKGMMKESSYEAHQYRIKEIDPGAPTYSLDYLRHHPEISIESVPWHIHTESMMQESDAAAPNRQKGMHP